MVHRIRVPGTSRNMAESHGIHPFPYDSKLEIGCEAQSEASRRADRVAGEKATEVDDVENVGEVLSVNLQTNIHSIRFVKIRTRRSIDLEGGVYAAAIEVDSIEYLLAVLCEDCVRVTIKLKRKPAVILYSAGNPEPWLYLIANSAANGVALVLRVRKMPAKLCFGGGSVGA